MMLKNINQNIVAYFSLFTSAGTLICCALPALLVTLGMGAALAGLVSNAPWLIAFSTHKELVFSIAGFMLLAAALLQWKNRNAPCPIDPKQAQACMRLRKMNVVILSVSILIYAIGFFFAFIAVHLFY
jgi:hypothetical protein